ncbi:MAG: glycogen/starch/alpha-glucan phosphorylase [Bacillota bacterium]|nr:glycogen/starch/alpha-glucan phosphorylase [Bacillota bacterium]
MKSQDKSQEKETKPPKTKAQEEQKVQTEAESPVEIKKIKKRTVKSPAVRKAQKEKNETDKVLRMLNEAAIRLFGCDVKEVTHQQMFKAVCSVVRDLMVKKRKEFHESYRANDDKQVYYMSMEFLVGRSLHNNLYNLGIEEKVANAVKKCGFEIEELYSIEPDAGLGNGGLGRLASCYLDSMTTLALPGTGFSIRYEFGIFRQKIVDGWQMEFPDDWLSLGDVWLQPREDEAFEVKFGGDVTGWDDNGKYRVTHTNYNSVIAIPYDMYISGYDTGAVNKLVLWSAKSPKSFDMTAFSRGEYAKSLEQNTMAEVISKVLYPADDHIAGKILRLKQQYLLVSASLQSIIANHFERYATLDNLAEKVAIHINDTHPALCVPELMRILVDDHEYGWDDAWKIACDTLTYTNHTVMSEALERWNEQLFKEQLPRIYQIAAEINRRLIAQLNVIYPGDVAKIEYMAVIAHGEIRMANLCLAACHKVNGVSQLHTNILKNGIFKDYYNITPERFTNVTNGIAYRRWLCQANPKLTAFLTEIIGDGFKHDSMELEKLMTYRDNEEVLENLVKIKYENKVNLANYISHANGVKVDPSSLFDVQVKRLHEYKRQLLNVLQILYMYNRIKANPDADFIPRTFIFAAKASAGYVMAKQIIRLIVAVSDMINSDPQTRDKIKVIFVEDYKVSLAEIIIPAAEISEQISIAGKEASGTGNMKLMINGAITLGTLDGANVEINEQVGDENMFLFGLHANEVEALWQKGYNPMDYCNNNPELKAVLEMLTSGKLGTRFDDVVRSLLTNNYGVADAYMILADFNDYVRAQNEVSMTYKDTEKFTRMSLVNIAKAGIFSSDRAVKQYAEEIWNMR